MGCRPLERPSASDRHARTGMQATTCLWSFAPAEKGMKFTSNQDQQIILGICIPPASSASSTVEEDSGPVN